MSDNGHSGFFNSQAFASAYPPHGYATQSNDEHFHCDIHAFIRDDLVSVLFEQQQRDTQPIEKRIALLASRPGMEPEVHDTPGITHEDTQMNEHGQDTAGVFIKDEPNDEEADMSIFPTQGTIIKEEHDLGTIDPALLQKNSLEPQNDPAHCENDENAQETIIKEEHDLGTIDPALLQKNIVEPQNDPAPFEISEHDEDAEGSDIKNEPNYASVALALSGNNPEPQQTSLCANINEFVAQNIPLVEDLVQPPTAAQIGRAARAERRRRRERKARRIEAFQQMSDKMIQDSAISSEVIESLQGLCPVDQDELSGEDKSALDKARRDWMMSHPPGKNRNFRYVFLLVARVWGLKYQDIKDLGGIEVAVTTLRGNMRTMVLPAEERVRSPKWEDADDDALIRGHAALTSRGVTRAFWLRLSRFMGDAGRYQFAAATVKKRWEKLVEEGRVPPPQE